MNTKCNGEHPSLSRGIFNTERSISVSRIECIVQYGQLPSEAAFRSEELCQLALSKSQMGGKVRGMLEAAKAQIQWYIERPQVGRFWWSGVGVEIEADYGAAHAQYH